MKIINQCLCNCYDQQLIYTHRDYYGNKIHTAHHLSLPAQPFVAPVLRVTAFHAAVLQLGGGRQSI